MRLTAKQTVALLLDDREVLYGGAAGGGKSVWLILDALRFADVPGYSAVLFRRTYPDLIRAKGLIPTAHEILRGTPAKWNESKKCFTFPTGSTPATLEFGFMEHEQDVFKYDGPAYQFVGYDEVSHFTEFQYTYMGSRLRRPSDAHDPLSRVPLRQRAATNPPDVRNPGWSWCRRHFIVEGPKNGVVFIPAKFGDNQFLDQEEYEQNLNRLDPFTRARLKDGNWDAVPAGRMFDRAWFGDPLRLRPEGLELCRFWDLAHSAAKPGRDPDWTAGALYGRRGGQLFLLDMRRMRGTPFESEALIQRTARQDGVETRIRMEQEPAGGKRIIEHFAREVLAGYDFLGVPAGSADPAVRWGPISAAAENGHVKLVEGSWLSAFLDEVEAAPSGTHDDQLTAWAGAHAELTLGERRKREPNIYAI